MSAKLKRKMETKKLDEKQREYEIKTLGENIDAREMREKIPYHRQINFDKGGVCYEEIKKKIFFGMMLLLLIGVVSADSYALYCLGNGEQVDFGVLCNPSMGKRTGPTNICVHLLDSGKICAANPNICNTLGLSCSSAGNATFDTEPPVLILNSPINGSLHTSRIVDFSFTTDESADVYYLDLINGRGRWSRICTDCRNYNHGLSFSDGLKELMIRATDRAGNTAYTNVSFFVDSQNPRIYKAEPKSGFADGNFKIQFKEDNPQELKLFYSDGIVTRNVGVNLQNCYEDKSKMNCEVYANLNEFDGKKIEYWFNLKDIAGNSVDSKKIKLDVDTSSPVINNLGNFWSKSGKYVYFNLNITEKNFDEASYSYFDSRGKERERKICSKLKDGFCAKRFTFTEGHYDLTIKVTDKAGNSVGVPVSFDVEY